MSAEQHVLTLACPNRPGIVAAVATHDLRAGLQHPECPAVRRRDTDWFFMRVVFNGATGPASVAQVRAGSGAHAERFGMPGRCANRDAAQR